MCQQLKLQAQLCPCSDLGVPGVWEVQNSVRLGSSEVEQVNSVIEACCALLELEARLERGGQDLTDLTQSLNLEVATGEAKRPRPPEEVFGSGDAEFPGFSAETCPPEMPDLSRHHSVMAEILTADPTIYQQLKDLRTPLGVSFARCIKPGVDTVGHSFFKMIGAAAGDEYCYDVFAKLFDPIIARRQVRSQVVSGSPAPAVVSVQVSFERNISQLRFTPAMTLEERLQVEQLLCGALQSLPEHLAGEYFPLPGSFRPMTEAKEAELRAEKWLFEVPDAPWILSSGRARYWPKARGVFLSKSKDFAAWINDENHLRLIVRRANGDLKAAVSLLSQAEEALTRFLLQNGHRFASSERLGFLTTCPSDLGAAFRAKLRSALPSLGHMTGFKEVTRALGIQAKRVASQDGMWDISLSSNQLDPSMDPTGQVNSLLFAAHHLSALERRLKSGESLDLVAEAEVLKQ